MRYSLATALILAFMVSSAALAGESVSYFKIGLYNPRSTDSGVDFNFSSGTAVDERVEVGFSLGYFSTKRKDSETIRVEDELTGTTYYVDVTSLESSIRMFPLLANLTIKFPSAMPVVPFISGGLGYTLLWSKYDNYLTNDNKTRFFGGFTYCFGVGGMFRIGSGSAVTAEIVYNSSHPSRKDDNDIGLPTRTELDMSGIGFRLGIRVGGFGMF